MTHAYDEMYLEKAQTSLALMLDFVVHDLGYDVDSFFSLFCVSPSGHAFAYGDVSVIAGRLNTGRGGLWHTTSGGQLFLSAG